MSLKNLIKDGCIIKNRKGVQWIAMPSIYMDFFFDNTSHVYCKETPDVFNDDLTHISDSEYDIMSIRYEKDYVWKRTEN